MLKHAETKIKISDSFNSSFKLLKDGKNFAFAPFAKKNEIINGVELQYVNITPYFLKAHQKSRELNKYFITKGLKSDLFLSIFKKTDEEFFYANRLNLVAEDISASKDSVVLSSGYAPLACDAQRIVNQSSNLKKIPFVTNLIYLFKVSLGVAKQIVLMSLYFMNLKNLFKSNKSINRLLFVLNDSIYRSFFTPYITPHSIEVPFFSLNRVRRAFSVFVYPTQFLKIVFHWTIDISPLLFAKIPFGIKALFLKSGFSILNDTLFFVGLLQQYPSAKELLGCFDHFDSSDYLSHVLTKNKKKVICNPHGMSFPFKCHYLSLGCHQYLFWSEKHKEFRERALLAKNEFKTECTITGNFHYSSVEKRENQNQPPPFRVLIIGEYFPEDQFYSSPFNQHATTRFFDTIKWVSENLPFEFFIRYRITDEYFDIASKYLSNNIHLCHPTEDIFHSLSSKDLVATVFSNAIHEALLVDVPVVQMNYLGLKGFRSLAEEGLCYEVFNHNEAISFFKKFSENEIVRLDFDLHRKQYCNSKKFIPYDSEK